MVIAHPMKSRSICTSSNCRCLFFLATCVYHTGWRSHINIISLIFTAMLFWFWSGDIDVLMGYPSSHLMPMHSINNLYSLSFQPFIFLFFVNAIEMRTHIIFLFKFWKFKREKLFESVELNRAGNDHIGWVHIFPRGEGATKLDLPITSSLLKKVVQRSNGQYQNLNIVTVTPACLK